MIDPTLALAGVGDTGRVLDLIIKWSEHERRLREIHDFKTHSGEIALLRAEQDRFECELATSYPE